MAAKLADIDGTESPVDYITLCWGVTKCGRIPWRFADDSLSCGSGKHSDAGAGNRTTTNANAAEGCGEARNGGAIKFNTGYGTQPPQGARRGGTEGGLKQTQSAKSDGGGPAVPVDGGPH